MNIFIYLYYTKLIYSEILVYCYLLLHSAYISLTQPKLELTKYFLHLRTQEPVQRCLGSSVWQCCKNSKSYTKVVKEYVYDVPLLLSLQQQLSDEHVLNEVT